MDDVDLALVLAFDASASVTLGEFAMMASGCATALREADVTAGLIGGPRGASACAVLVWSGHAAHEVMIEWTRLESAGAVAQFSAGVENVPRTVRAGSTAIGEALQACEALFATLAFPARRRIIDMVGDGRSNEGTPPGPVRDRLIEAGVTINGLCVLHEEPDLLDSYRREVIGGADAFALLCADFDGFAAAIARKLQREIAGLPKSWAAPIKTGLNSRILTL